MILRDIKWIQDFRVLSTGMIYKRSAITRGNKIAVHKGEEDFIFLDENTEVVAVDSELFTNRK